MRLDINGSPREYEGGDKTPLLEVLRNEVGLCGAKFGCGEGECGACMVLVDGKAITSCDLPVWSLEGKKIVTIEGIGSPSKPHPIQQCLIEERAGQCGYCLAGITVAAVELLSRSPNPTRAEILAGLDRNLCRCGTHSRIVRAVERAAARMQGADHG